MPHCVATQLRADASDGLGTFISQRKGKIAKATACYPSLKTTTTRGLIVGLFDLKHVCGPLPWLILLAVPDPAPPPPKEAVTN